MDDDDDGDEVEEDEDDEGEVGVNGKELFEIVCNGTIYDCLELIEY